MPVGQSSFVFSFRDIGTRVLPGSVAILPGTIVIAANNPHIYNNHSVFLLGFLLISYVLGELINLLRLRIARVPISFQRWVAQETEDDSIRPRGDKFVDWVFKSVINRFWPLSTLYRGINELVNGIKTGISKLAPNFIQYNEAEPLTDELEMDFQDAIEYELSVDFEENSVRNIFDLMILHLEPHMHRRSERYQVLYALSHNVNFAIAFSGIIYVSYLLYFGILGDWFVWGFIAFGFWVAILIVWQLPSVILGQVHTDYTEMIFKEFYLLHNDETHQRSLSDWD